MILIGSRALMLRKPEALQRKPVDFDYVCHQSEFNSWLESNKDKIKISSIYPSVNINNNVHKMIVEGNTNFEFEIITPGTSSEELEDLIKSDKDTMESPFGLIPSFDMLFTIKSSHKYLKNSPHFWKTVLDYHTMKSLEAKVRPEWKDFLKFREKETYWYKHPKLNQNKNSFFSDDNIQYVYDHDSIHESVAVKDKPAYTHYMKDGAEIDCDKNKFFSCSHEIRINGVIEEAAVLAIERSLVPHPGVKTPKEAWLLALSKVCSSITSGWFREFAYENIIEVLSLYPEGYWENFQYEVSIGKVKKLKELNQPMV